MELQILTNYAEMSQAAAATILAAIERNPQLLLCLATGETPKGTYEALASLCSERPSAVSQIRAVKLDEWSGMLMTDPGSCEVYLQERVIRPLAISPDRYMGFTSDASNPTAECQRISKWLKLNGRIDLCILGLGANGHLGLNEPGSILLPEAHQTTLESSTRRHSMLEIAQSMPSRGLTLGMAEILQSREIILLVSGTQKKQQLKRLLIKEISTQFPASLLWLHPRTTIICDTDAMSP